jgi:hypothetical protein
MMTNGTGKFTDVGFKDGRELTQDELDAASGGTPATNSHSPTNFLKIELKEIFITSPSI